MKMLSIITICLMMVCLTIPSVRAEEPAPSFMGWLWNQATGLWDYFFEGEVIATSETRPNAPLIIEEDAQWQMLSARGLESNFTLQTINAKDKKTELCFVLKPNTTADLSDRSLYDESGVILDDKSKAIILKYETAKCQGEDGYHISLTNAQAINIDDYIKLGENSAEAVYVNQTKIGYDLGFASMNISITDDTLPAGINEIWITQNPDNYKFGANHTGMNTTELHDFTYTLESTNPIYLDNWIAYLINPQKITSDLGVHEVYEQIKFHDVCVRNFKPYNTTEEILGENYTVTRYNKNADCEFEQWDNGETYYLNVSFLSDKYIDPTITNITADSTFEDVRCESDDFCHLSVSNESLVLYMPFNNENKTIYDWTDNNNDGSVVGQVDYITDAGLEGGAMKFGGSTDYISIDDSVSLSITGAITLSLWANFTNLAGGDGCFLTKNSGTQECFVSISDKVYDFGILNDGLYFQIGDGATGDLAGPVDISSYEDGKWHHIVARWDGTTGATAMDIWVDGIQRVTGDADNSAIQDTADMLIIGGPDTYEYNGQMDEVMVFNTNITDADILLINNSGGGFPRFAQNGTQLLSPAINSGASTVNLSLNISANQFNSSVTNISVSVYNGTDFSDYVNMTNGVYQVFDVPNYTANLNLSIQYHTNESRFWSPILFAPITYTTNKSVWRIRTNDTGLSNSSGEDTVFFDEMPSTNYVALASALEDDDTVYTLQYYLLKNLSDMTFLVHDDQGGEEVADFMYGVFEAGHVNYKNNHLECGSFHQDTQTIDANMTFDFPFINNDYTVIANVHNDTEPTIAILKNNADKNTTQFGLHFNDDGGANEFVYDFDWCAFQHGEYDIGEVSIKSGNNSFQDALADNIIVVNFTSNFSDTNFVVFTMDETSYSQDGCSCQMKSRDVGGFTAVCRDDGGSVAACNGEAFGWVAIEKGSFNSSLGATEEPPPEGDTTPPNATINTPLNQTFNTTTIFFNFTALDEVNMSTCLYSLNNGTANYTMTNSSTAPNDWTATNSSMKQGDIRVRAYCNDTTNNWNITSVQDFFIDSIPPNVTNFSETPTDGVEYSPNQVYEFNATILDAGTLDEVKFEFNEVNYTTTITGNSFNSTLSNLSVGTYNYRWFANDSLNNTNSSETGTYEVVQNTSYSLNLAITPSTSETYGIETTATGTNCPPELACNLSMDLINADNPNITTLGAGTYNYTYNSSGNANYDIFQISEVLTINQNTSLINLTLNSTQGNISILQGESIDLNCTTITGDDVAYLTLYNNSNIINNATSPITNLTGFADIGVFNVTCIYEETNNFTRSSQEYYVNVTAPVTATIDLDIMYPLNFSDINVTQNGFFNVTLNITCRGANCGAINVSLDPETICVQEFANVSTGCGGLDTGEYNWSFPWVDGFPNRFIDGDWATSAVCEPGANPDCYSFTNYSKPSSALPSSLFQIKWSPAGGIETQNYSIPIDCWNKNPIEFRVHTYNDSHANEGANITCHDGSKWFQLNESTGGANNIFDENIIWNLTDSKLGLISNTTGDTPFYTNGSNPWQVTLNVNESQVLVFTVNATGAINTTHVFYAFANMTSDLNVGNISERWNVTIKGSGIDSTNPAVTSLTETPTDGSEFEEDFAYEFNATITDDGGLDNITLQFNGVNYSVINAGDVYSYSTSNLSVGNYTYRWFANDITGNINNTGNGTYEIVGNSSYSLALAITPSTSETYGIETTATGTKCPTQLACNLSMDLINADNPNITTLGAGTYNYTYNSSGNANYSIYQISEILTINQNTSLINLTLNSTQGNISILQGESIDLNCTTITGDDVAYLTLYNNSNIINNATSPITNFTGFSDVGVFNVTCIYEETNNFTRSSEEWYVNVTAVVETTPPNITNVMFWAINSTGDVLGNAESFNSSDLEEIEKMQINFTLIDDTGFGSDIIFYYTANGSHSCALGNLQSAVCYNLTDDTWVEVKNNTETTTFNDIIEIGDYINISYIEVNSTYRDYNIIIDEHYNPNVFKHYEADYNFSIIKWQDGTDQRITQDNEIIIRINEDLLPLDADQYKLDFRVNYTTGTNEPIQPLEAYACNSSYITGNVETSVNCMLIAEKLPSELQGDGTKFRGIFTKQEVDDLGDIEFIVLETDENNPNKYYTLKTINASVGSYITQWNYTTDAGDTWLNLGDGYETELNINWFYNGANPTEFLFKVFTNDSLNNNANSSIFNLTWNINPNQNYPPLIDIIIPIINATVNGTIEINWTTVEPNDDNWTTNITARNETTQVNITLDLPNTYSNTTWNTSLVADGYWNITVESCENETTDLYCVNATHQVFINNTIADITPPYFIVIPANASLAFNTSLSVIFNGSDETGNGTFAVNDSRFFINSTSGVLNNSIVLGVKTYVLNISFNDTSGNSNSTLWQVTYNQIASEVNTTINNSRSNTTIEQGSSIDLNCSTFKGDDVAYLTLYNGSNIINNGTSPIGNLTGFGDVGVFNVTCIYENTQNYTRSSEEYYVNVTAIVDTTIPTFDELPVNQIIPYNTSFSYDLNASDETLFDCFNVDDAKYNITCEGIMRNTTTVEAGIRTINITINDSSNNLNSALFNINVSRLSGIVFAYVNNTRTAFTAFNNSDKNHTNILLNGTLIHGTGIINLSLNGTQINFNQTNAYNLTNLSIGTYNFTAKYGGDQNFTSAIESWIINIIASTPPSIAKAIKGCSTLSVLYDNLRLPAVRRKRCVI